MSSAIHSLVGHRLFTKGNFCHLLQLLLCPLNFIHLSLIFVIFIIIDLVILNLFFFIQDGMRLELHILSLVADLISFGFHNSSAMKALLPFVHLF